MRIVYVLTSLGMGGAERQVLAVADRMAARGHAVALMVLRSELAEEWPTTLDLVRLDLRRNPASMFAGLRRGRNFLSAFHPDLVHSHSFHANVVARLLKFAGCTPAVVSTIHNVYEGAWHRMLAYRLTDFLSMRTTAVSAAARERFVRLKAVPESKCIVVPNGIDTAEFSTVPARRTSTRAAMHAAPDFIWMAAGRIVPAKDYPNLLRAFHAVRNARPDVQLWIAGDASPLDVENFRRREATEGVHWLGLRRDIPALLDAADGFVLASAWEGMPLVVGEAMAMEKPVVATDVGGVRELVAETGTIVAAKDSDVLGNAMLEVMRLSDDGRLRMGRAARERITTQFSIQARADQWEQLYRELVQESSHRIR